MNKKHLAKGEVTKKKITFASAILLVMGSSIGAGIFLKNYEVLQNVGGSVVLALISWILSIVGVICMGISLSEIASNDEKSNLGVIQWVKKFNSKFLFKTAKYFMAIIYLPFNFFVMPYYAVMTIQDAFGWQTYWWVAALIAFAIMAYFFLTAGISSRVADVQNKIVLSVKFIPLAFCALAGIILACCGYCKVTPEVNPGWDPQIDYPGWLPSNWGMNPETKSLAQLFPVLGIFGSIPAIIFSFDGFYASAGIQSEMQEPKKTPLALVVGLLVVSTLDVLITISLLVGSQNGKISTLNFFSDSNWHIVISIMEVLIAFGVLGIVNGFAVYNPRYYEDLIKDGQLPFSGKLKNKINPNKPWIGMLYSGVLCLFFFIVLTLIGAIFYSDVSSYANVQMILPFGEKGQLGYNKGVASNGDLNSLYSFCDLMANWTSILVFLCIVVATIGCLKNRKTNKVKVIRAKGFVPCAIISTIIIGLAIVFILSSTFGNIALVYTRGGTGEEKLGAIMTLVVLVLFVLICIIPSAIEMKKEKGKPITYRPWAI